MCDLNTPSTLCNPICGDGKLVPLEICDDENTVSFDGCSLDCNIVEIGWECTGGSRTTKDVCVAICGDGMIYGSEICDDGNEIDEEGCLDDCLGMIDGWDC